MKKTTKYLFSLLLIFVLPVLVMAQSKDVNEKPIQLPKDMEETKGFLNNFVVFLPQAMKKAWEQTLVFWTKLFGEGKIVWKTSLGESIAELNIVKFITQEFKIKYSTFNSELEKEIQGTKQEILMLIKKLLPKKE